MIQTYSILNVADNTGAKKVMCIGILGNNRTRAGIGDIIIGSVKKATPNMNIKRSDIVHGVIVRTQQAFSRKNGSKIRFSENSLVIISPDKTPKGSRVFGPIPHELKEKNYLKIISLAEEIV
jgi:large subunit ribosomal protein L14